MEGEPLLLPLSTCQLRQMTLPLEHESTFSHSLQRGGKKEPLIPKKWNRQKHLPLHLRHAHLLQVQKKYPSPRTQCTALRGQGFDRRTGESDSCPAARRGSRTSQADYRGMEKRHGGGSTSPSVTPLTPTPPEGDNRRQKPDMSAFSHDSFIPPPLAICAHHGTYTPRLDVLMAAGDRILYHKQADEKNLPTWFLSLFFISIYTFSNKYYPKTTRNTVFYAANDTWKLLM